MSLSRALSLAAACLSVVGAPRLARADIAGAPPGWQMVFSTYEVEGANDFPETVFITYPSGCDRSGSPDWLPPTDPRRTVGYLNYEVLIPGHRASLGRPCEQGAGIYALGSDQFTYVKHPPVDGPIGPVGVRRGEAYATLKQLDTCPDRARCEALLQPPRGQKLGYTIENTEALREPTSVARIHDVLSVQRRPGGGFEVKPLRVTYTYVGAEEQTETLPYGPDGVRPRPTRDRQAPGAEPTPSARARAPEPASEPPADDSRHTAAYLAGAAAMMMAGVIALVVKGQKARA